MTAGPQRRSVRRMVATTDLLLLGGGVIGLLALHARYGSVLHAVGKSYLPTSLAVSAVVWGALGTARSLFGWPGAVVASMVIVLPVVGWAVVARRRHRT